MSQKSLKLGVLKWYFCTMMAPTMGTRLVENNGGQAI